MSTQMVPMHSPEEYGSPRFVPAVPARYIYFGAFHLDTKKEELFKDGSRVKLQGKVYQVLAALLQKPGEIVTREELRLRLWPSGTFVDYDSNMNTTVNKLRQVLGDPSDQPAFVETIPRKGYTFVAKVEYLDRPVAPQAPRSAELASVTAAAEHANAKASFFQTTILSGWFTTSVVTLVIASMLFGAALVLYAHR
jgi:DNA-binding winged helix-turn-helix (wHTH) protein